jgi:hypothetical protein
MEIEELTKCETKQQLSVVNIQNKKRRKLNSEGSIQTTGANLRQSIIKIIKEIHQIEQTNQQTEITKQAEIIKQQNLKSIIEINFIK